MKFTIDKREEIDSTNLEVIRRAKTGAPEGTLVQAERQISGRGRRGRAWESPAGSNLYMTLLLRPDVTMEQVHFNRQVPLGSIAKTMAVGEKNR